MSKTIKDLPSFDITPEDRETGRLSMVVAEAADKYGPILRYVPTHYDYKGNGFVFMVGPEANRFVFHTHRDHFSHHRGWTPIFGKSLGKGLLNMDTPEHAEHRKIWNPAFSRSYIESYLPQMQEIIENRTADWAARGEVNAYDEAREITFAVAAKVLAGFKVTSEVDELQRLFYTMIHSFDATRETWSAYSARRNTARQQLSRLILGLIRKRRRLSPEEMGKDVLSVMIQAKLPAPTPNPSPNTRGGGQKKRYDKRLNNAQLLAHINILLVAGHETTTTLSAWTLYHLAAYPNEARRVKNEIQQVLGEEATISLAAIQEMPLLDRFVREVGRLYPPIINLPRGIREPFTFNGYDITGRGRRIRLALGAAHRLSRVFTDPHTFDPDRLAPPREEDRQIPYSLATFGGGARICIGINVAQIEVKMLVIHLLRHFDFELVPNQTPVHEGHWVARIPAGVHLYVRDMVPTQ